MEDHVPNEWWKAACKHIRSPLACVSNDHKFIWINNGWCKLLGYSPTELIGNTWMDFTRVEDIGGDISSVEKVLNGELEEYFIEKMYRRKDGTYIPVSLYVHRFPEVGDLVCFIVDAEDNTKDQSMAQLKKEFEILRHNLVDLNNQVIVLNKRTVFKELGQFVKGNWLYITGIAAFVGTLLKWLLDFILHLLDK